MPEHVGKSALAGYGIRAGRAGVDQRCQSPREFSGPVNGDLIDDGRSLAALDVMPQHQTGAGHAVDVRHRGT